MSLETDRVWGQFKACLRGFILKRVGDEHTADEILQDAFVKIHANLGNLKDESKLRPWLYQIVRNTITDHFRVRRPTTEPLEEEAVLVWEAGPGKDPSEEIAPCIRALVKRLPDRDRRSIEDVEFEGLTQRELSEKLNISFSGAKSRVQRARRRLKDLLLECCSFDLDRQGCVLDYKPRNSPLSDCCKDDPC